MMNETKNEIPEALRVAEHLELYATFGRGDRSHDAARLLREQHEEIVRLREVLDKLEYSFDGAIKRYPDEHEVEVALQQEQPR